MHPYTTPRWLVAFVAGLLVAAVAAVGAWTVELPYLGWSPGPVAEALDAIIVDDGLEAYPPEGELLVLTISSQPLNVYELLVAGFDPTIDVLEKSAVRRDGETDEEYRTRVLGQMDTAVHRALAVAFDRLGIDPGEVRVRVETVFGEYPAAAVLQPGDLLFEIDGTPVGTVPDIRSILAERRPGDTVTLMIERAGTTLEVTVELAGTTEEATGEIRPIIGIAPGPYHVDPPAEIDTNNIGGPSAGMMYTLALIDLLSDGDLTRGHVVAGTGTIEADGSVGGIGGIRQKVVAAEAAGAEYMLVPESNYDEALTAEREALELVRVATIDDALAFFGTLPPAGSAQA